MASPDFTFGFDAPKLGSQFLPLDLGAAGIGTPNTFDSSKPGDNFAPAISGFYTGTAGAPATASADGTTASAAGSIPSIGGIEGWFLRGTVIILGFIFIAVGLAMFKQPGTTVIEATKGIAAKAVP